MGEGCHFDGCGATGSVAVVLSRPPDWESNTLNLTTPSDFFSSSSFWFVNEPASVNAKNLSLS